MQILKKVPNKEDRYSESYQDLAIKFTFAHRDGDTAQELFKSFICRDYFNDILYCEETGESTGEGIYGFHFDPEEFRIDRDKTRISLQFPTTKVRDTFLKNIEILHSIEKENKFSETKTFVGQDAYLLVEGDPEWMAANHRLSLYTFLIKCVSNHIKDKNNWVDSVDNREKGYLDSIGKEKFLFLSKQLNKIIDPYKGITGVKKKTSISIVHDCTGFLSTFHYTYSDWNPTPLTIYAERARDLWTKCKH